VALVKNYIGKISFDIDRILSMDESLLVGV
jgi:hypothetical protein